MVSTRGVVLSAGRVILTWGLELTFCLAKAKVGYMEVRVIEKMLFAFEGIVLCYVE